LFVGQEPVNPINSVTIFDTPGFPPQLTYDPTEKYEKPAIQIRVRNASYIAGYQLAYNIKDVLHGLSNHIQNGTTYVLIQCMQDPFLLDYDSAGHPRFVCNFDIQRR
jgi:hypothetical protein